MICTKTKKVVFTSLLSLRKRPKGRAVKQKENCPWSLFELPQKCKLQKLHFSQPPNNFGPHCNATLCTFRSKKASFLKKASWRPSGERRKKNNSIICELYFYYLSFPRFFFNFERSDPDFPKIFVPLHSNREFHMAKRTQEDYYKQSKRIREEVLQQAELLKGSPLRFIITNEITMRVEITPS